MKLAAVINVGHGSAALEHAVATQTLMLDRLSARLNSIRLAAPRLLRQACVSAIAEKPDILIVAGGPRSARRAGDLAHRHDIPILFLCGPGNWVRHLSGYLSLEDMIAAVAHEDLRPFRLGVGMAGEQVFFERASCGLLPHLPELQGALEEADTFAEGWHVMGRAAELAHFLVSPNVRFDSGNSGPKRASALIISPAAQIENWREGASAALKCSAIHYGTLGIVGALVRSSMSGGWQSERKEDFESGTLRVDAGRPSWILLDGDPVRFDGIVEFRFKPAALQTFAFNAAHGCANDNHPDAARPSQSLNLASELDWNFPALPHVDSFEGRGSGYPRH